MSLLILFSYVLFIQVASSNVRTQQPKNNTSVINIDTLRLPSTISQQQNLQMLQPENYNLKNQHAEVDNHQNIAKPLTGY